jgi:uncharacterized protein
MVSIIEENRQELTELCRLYHVFRLDVFGSVVTDEFDRAKSDIDFLVEFDSSVNERRFDNYFEFRKELVRLFGMKIDLVEPGGLRNPYFIRRVNETRRPLYVAT